MRLAVVLVLALALDARADPDLRVRHEPAPHHLQMRPRRAAQAAIRPASASPLPPLPRAPEGAEEAKLVRNVDQRISARVDIGYVVDGTAVTGMPDKSGVTPVPGHDFATTRSYGFGESYVGTRGVGLESLSTYFAAKFQIARRTVVTIDPTNVNPQTTVGPPPIATWFDRSGLETKAGWAEIKDFMPGHKLKPLRIRAGELYVYGPWMLHMYGALSEWDGKLVRATAYIGSRVPDYTLTAPAGTDRAGIGGANVRIDLRALQQPVPLSVGIETLGFTAADQSQASGHSQLELDWRPKDNLAFVGDARTIGNDLANEHVQVRAKYSDVTNLTFDLTHRHSVDWRWDPSVVGAPQTDPLEPRRYLNLGPVLPQLLMSLRGGTLIWENIDAYARIAIASDLTGDPTQKSTYSASYVEGGGALELRLRRTVALGATALTRQTQRFDLDSAQIRDNPGVIDPLPANPSSPALGERGFTELGVNARMSLGARKFSAVVEVYGRRTRYAQIYCTTGCDTAVTGLTTDELRGGGRVTIDAWIGRQVRLFASYDLSSGLPFSPDITGYKSLKLMMEGVY